MPHVVDLADSELADIAREGTHVRARLSAAAARDDAGQRGWLTSVTLTIATATVRGDATHAFGRIVEGTLRHGGDRIGLAVPATLQGDIELALRLANGTRFVVRGCALDASVAADTRFREDFSC